MPEPRPTGGSGHRARSIGERLVREVEAQEWLDRPSYRFEHVMATSLNLPGDASTPIRNALHGTWLGHPLHPALTDIPVGAWTMAMILDGLDAIRPSTGRRRAARLAVGVGVLGGMASAVTGMADWQYTHDNARRVGTVHGALNAATLALYAASWRARHKTRPAGRAISAAGFGLLAVSAYLGGVLVYQHRIGVDHSDDQLEPRRFVAVLPDAEMPEGAVRRCKADGVDVAVARCGSQIAALGGRCPHLGGPTAEGWLYQGSLVCPWHGSRFDLQTGAVVRGPATAPLPCFETRVRDGNIEIRRRSRSPRSSPGSVVAEDQGRADARY